MNSFTNKGGQLHTQNRWPNDSDSLKYDYAIFEVNVVAKKKKKK